MRSGQFVAFAFCTAFSVSTSATTLKLHQDIELIAIDGQKVSSSLLKGADSLELDNDQHQLLFRVVKSLTPSGDERKTYTSPALLATFNMLNLDTVTIQLPPLDTPSARELFERDSNFQLLDLHHSQINARVDKLELSNDDIANRLESILAQYNATNRAASVAAFASGQPKTKKWPDNASSNTQDGIEPFMILKYWFRQADKETQERFIKWAKEREDQ